MEEIVHPCVSGFPFIELSDVQTGREMRSQLGNEVIACSPIDVNGGRGSYFNTVYEENKRVFVRTMMGRSDRTDNVWVYAREEVTELNEDDPNYAIAQQLLKLAA